MKKILCVLVVGLFFQGCASWLTEDDHARIEQEMTPVVQPAPVAEATVEEEVVPDEEPLSRYSQLNNMAPPSDRQYKRMTRERMEFESELNSSAGSLWKMEGQSAFLFAENKHRRQGDPTSIKMEGAALKMVENKVAVIQDLLGRLDEQRIKAEEESRIAGEEKIRLAQYEAEQKFRAEQIAKGVIKVDPEQEAAFAALEAQYLADTRKPASVAKEANPAAKADKIDLKEVELIPSKIVEKMAGDTYRIRGQQYLTIKDKPYKVIATAVVRMEDFRDDGVSSNKLLDAQYDVVHVKRTAE